MANVTEMPPQEGQPEPDIAAESATESATSASSSSRRPLNKGGRPKVNANTPPNPDPAFFKKVAAIPSEDWGTRAYMYCYIDEPACVAKTWGQYSYALKLKQPILDLEMLKERYGSHKGWLSLNTRKSGKDATDQIDRYEYEIFDPLAPPKIPRGAWANDTRNDRWRALLPAEPPTASAAATSLVDAIKVYKDIRDEVKDEMPAAEAAPNSARDTLETMKLAKELFAPATPAAATTPPADPFDTAAKIMAMRANDPMTAVLMQMLTNANTATEAARDREFKLQEKLFEAKAAVPASKSFLESALELASNPDKLEPLKKLASVFGFGNGGESVGRPGKTTGMDILNNLVSGPAGAQLAQGLGSVLMALPSMFQGNPANGVSHPPPVVLPPIAAAPPQPETPEQRIQRIGEAVTRQMLGEFFMKNATGADFAASMHNFWPEDTVFLQSLGAENLVNRYRRYPQAWSVISYREQDFIQFITEFCAWTPEEDEGPVPPGNEDDGVVDLEPEVGA